MTNEILKARKRRIREIEESLADALNEAITRYDLTCPLCKRHGAHYGNCVLAELEAHKLAVRGYYPTDS